MLPEACFAADRVYSSVMRLFASLIGCLLAGPYVLKGVQKRFLQGFDVRSPKSPVVLLGPNNVNPTGKCNIDNFIIIWKNSWSLN